MPLSLTESILEVHNNMITLWILCISVQLKCDSLKYNFIMMQPNQLSLKSNCKFVYLK